MDMKQETATLAFLTAKGVMMEETFPRYTRDGVKVCPLSDDYGRMMKATDYAEANRRYDALPFSAQAVYADFIRAGDDPRRQNLFENLDAAALNTYRDALNDAGLTHAMGHANAVSDRLHNNGLRGAEPVWSINGKPVSDSRATPGQIAYQRRELSLFAAGAMETAHVKNDERDLARLAGISPAEARTALDAPIAQSHRQKQTPRI